MSKYVYQRSFFGGKLVDPKTGEELKISGSKMRARATAANGKFVMISRLGQTPALHSVDRLDSSILEGHSENGIHCKMSLATGAVSEPYTMTKSGYISTPDGKLNVLDKNLQSKVTGYGTVRDEKGVPIVKVLLTRSSNDFAVAQNAQGKFGVISPDGRAVCPFVYDSPEIALNHEFPSERGYPKTYSFVGKGKEIISNENGVVIAEKPFTAPYNEVFRDGSTVYYSSYDKKKDVSTVMSMNTYTGKVSEYASLQGKVYCGAAYSHGDVVFCTGLNGKKGLVSKDGTVVLDHKYDDIRARTIHTHYSSEPVFELVNTETTESGKTSKLGIYSLRDSKVSFEPGIGISNCSTHQRGVGDDWNSGINYGTFRTCNFCSLCDGNLSGL